MTVAAAVLAASPESAIADADGQPSVRRIADAAWSGGALPIVVVSFDPDGTVAAALAGSPATLADPAPVEAGPVGQISRGMDVARGLVDETDAILVWPARLVWVGPETVTSLIEAHGAHPSAVLEPTYHDEAGWPKLVPVAHLATFRSLSPTAMPDELFAAFRATGAPFVAIELGDPGSSIDRGTPRAGLPPYEGPPAPTAGHAHEWGEGIAEIDQEHPPAGA